METQVVFKIFLSLLAIGLMGISYAHINAKINFGLIFPNLKLSSWNTMGAAWRDLLNKIFRLPKVYVVYQIILNWFDFVLICLNFLQSFQFFYFPPREIVLTPRLSTLWNFYGEFGNYTICNFLWISDIEPPSGMIYNSLNFNNDIT